MEKIKWHYDKNIKQWYTGETVPYSNDGFTITKDSKTYTLDYNYSFIGTFKKLSSAKKVAQLLRFG